MSILNNNKHITINNHFGWLKWCNLILYIYPFPLFKNFLTYLAALAHTAHAGLVVDFPLFSSFLIFTPRQQGWLASTISCLLACKPLNNTKFTNTFLFLFRGKFDNI